MLRKVFLAGGHVTPFVGKGSPNFQKGLKGLKEYFAESIQGAFRETGAKPEAIDRIYVGNFAGELFNSQGHLGAAVAAAHPALLHRPSMRVEAACASGGLACAEAVRAICAGDDIVLAVGVEVQTEVKLPLEKAVAGPEFLKNEELKPFVRATHCSQVSDGGAAAIFVSEEGLRKCGLSKHQAVEIVATDYGAGDLWSDPEDLAVMDTTRAVVSRMLASAGVKPSDLDVAEVHDCFAIAEILMYEAIGLAPPGKGTELVKSGATSLEGKIPVNTGGGLISFGHPVGATGVKQVLEIYRQMKGLCGDYQMKSQPNLGLCVNMGGDDKTCSAMLLRNTAPASKL
ncbi:SCP2 [Symbiodinium necroappetens]|uniref:propanoyl-CoA C-acyltransferase n=1 Tax=Symbiodinium necroappetens TaxID=1628268 RepID=A0A813A610_9DINO|nr:SCP2 [Symbiodinium necroappetens]